MVRTAEKRTRAARGNLEGRTNRAILASNPRTRAELISSFVATVDSRMRILAHVYKPGVWHVHEKSRRITELFLRENRHMLELGKSLFGSGERSLPFLHKVKRTFARRHPARWFVETRARDYYANADGFRTRSFRKTNFFRIRPKRTAQDPQNARCPS